MGDDPQYNEKTILWTGKRADCLMRFGNYDKAYQDYSKIIRIGISAGQERYFNATVNGAICLTNLGKVQEATSMAKDAVATANGDAQLIRAKVALYNAQFEGDDVSNGTLYDLCASIDDIYKMHPEWSYDRVKNLWAMFDVCEENAQCKQTTDRVKMALLQTDHYPSREEYLRMLIKYDCFSEEWVVDFPKMESYYKQLETCYKSNIKPEREGDRINISGDREAGYVTYIKATDFLSQAYAAQHGLPESIRYGDKVIELCKLNENGSFAENLALSQRLIQDKTLVDAYERNAYNYIFSADAKNIYRASDYLKDACDLIVKQYNRFISILPDMSQPDRAAVIDFYYELVPKTSEWAALSDRMKLPDPIIKETAFNTSLFYKGLLLEYERYPNVDLILLQDIKHSAGDAVLVSFVETQDSHIIATVYDGKSGMITSIPLEIDTNDGTYGSVAMYSDGHYYTKLWGPIFSRIGEGRTIYYTLSGNIQLVNVEALVDENGIMAYKKSDLHLLSSFREIGRPYSVFNPERVALFGNLSYSGWASLPSSKKEVESIAALLQSKNIPVSLYEGADGTKNNAMSISSTCPDILHFATHAFYHKTESSEYDAPLTQSGLVFASVNSLDEVLYGSDIEKMDLSKTKLLVLSACDTGTGKISYEGVSGLQRAFKKAGAQTILMSLWRLNDDSTSSFMTDFYSFLLEGQDPADAFKKARDSTRLKYKYPYYWAPFILLD